MLLALSLMQLVVEERLPVTSDSLPLLGESDFYRLTEMYHKCTVVWFKHAVRPDVCETISPMAIPVISGN